MNKYRGKRIDNGEWVYGYLIGDDVIVGEIVEWDDDYFCTEFWVKVDPETVGQYTGLNDNKGKSIYDHDIVKDEFDRVYLVYWHAKEARFTMRGIKRKTKYFMVIDHLKLEVIGNALDHPHLLKGEGENE